MAIKIDFNDYQTMEDFHDDIEKKLELPVYYGRNLDALHDVIGELAPESVSFDIVFGGQLPERTQHIIASILRGEA